MNRIIKSVRNALNDNGKIYRWPDDELVMYFNEAQVYVVAHRPDANMVTKTIQLVPGTLQSIPDDGIAMHNITKNADGSIPRYTVWSKFTSRNPSWETDTPSDTVQRWMQDPINPRKFHVYPPNTGSFVEIVYIGVPEDIKTVDDDSVLPRQYDSVLTNYILYKAYSKNIAISPSAQNKAVGYLKLVLGDLNVENQ